MKEARGKKKKNQPISRHFWPPADAARDDTPHPRGDLGFFSSFPTAERATGFRVAAGKARQSPLEVRDERSPPGTFGRCWIQSPVPPTPVCLQATTPAPSCRQQSRDRRDAANPRGLGQHCRQRGGRLRSGASPWHAGYGRLPRHPASRCPSARKSTRLESSRIHLGFTQRRFFLRSLFSADFLFYFPREQSKASALRRHLVANFILQIRCKVPRTRHQQTEFKSPDSTSNFVAADRGFCKSFV